MARILDALNHTEPPPASVPAAPDSAAVATPVQAEEEIPYIEVGGSQMEASEAVRRAPGPQNARESVRLVLHKPEAETPAVRFRPVQTDASSPRERLAPELIAFHQPDHVVSQQYRELLEHLLAPGAEGAPVLLLSGAGNEVGATTVLLNLAITAARREARVIVVDAALHGPALAQRLGLTPAPGLHEVLAGLTSLPRALQETGIANLHALTAGEIGIRPCWAVRSLGATLNQLRKRFDLVLVDGPAGTGGAEMAALANAGAAVYLVLPHDQADSAEMNALLQKLQRQGVCVRGCIIVQR